MTKERRDIHQEITDKVVAQLDAGDRPWTKDWSGGTMRMPLRANGQPYRGINTLVLWMTAMERDYSAAHWMTFKQAQSFGACVRKGEKGTGIIKVGTFEKEDAGSGELQKLTFAKAYTVFNVQQIDGLGPEWLADAAVVDSGARHDDELSAFFTSVGARVIEDGRGPCYRHLTDDILMPLVGQFASAGAYYGTLAHEVAHWTGAASRLDRGKGLDRTQEDYAFEELVAELASAFVCAELDTPVDLANAAAYVGSWLKALRGDKRYIFRAAAQAQKAADYIMERGRPALTFVAAEADQVAA